MTTKLLYMEDMQALTCEAQVKEVAHQEDRTIIYLDQTVFYPQGGGQPYDTGVISSETAKFNVEEVRFIDGKVLHIGHQHTGELKLGDTVKCAVDQDRRSLNTRLHSGGHLLDMAIYELGYDWKPTKGYHFPNGAYVEYQGDIEDEPKEEIIEKVNQQITDILSRGIKTELRFMSKEEMTRYCPHVPDYLPAGKPSRIVLYGDFGVPCGGTHVAKLSDLGSVRVRKIKGQSGVLRAAYELS